MNSCLPCISLNLRDWWEWPFKKCVLPFVASGSRVETRWDSRVLKGPCRARLRKVGLWRGLREWRKWLEMATSCNQELTSRQGRVRRVTSGHCVTEADVSMVTGARCCLPRSSAGPHRSSGSWWCHCPRWTREARRAEVTCPGPHEWGWEPSMAEWTSKNVRHCNNVKIGGKEMMALIRRCKLWKRELTDGRIGL